MDVINSKNQKWKKWTSIQNIVRRAISVTIKKQKRDYLNKHQIIEKYGGNFTDFLVKPLFFIKFLIALCAHMYIIISVYKSRIL